MGRHVVLVGLPGVGKSTIGRGLAARLERGFVDLDGEIARRARMFVTTIFEVEGEAGFRRREAEVSQLLASEPAELVLAAGGGWMANEAAVAHLRPASCIIYLRGSPAGVLRRMGRGVVRRPLLRGADPLAVLQRLYESRRVVYETADITVDAELVARQQLIEIIAEHVAAFPEYSVDRHDG